MRLACGCQPAVVCGSRPEAPFAISCDETIAGIGLDEAKMARSFNKHLQRNLGNRVQRFQHWKAQRKLWVLPISQPQTM